MMRKIVSFIIGFVLITSVCFAQDQTVQTPAADVQITEVAPFYYAAVVMTGSYAQHSDAIQNLMTQTNLQEVPVDMEMFGIYYSDPSQVPEDSLLWEVGMKMTEQKELTDPLTLKKWEYPLIASIQYSGSFDETDSVYSALFGWIAQNNYVPAGPVMEKFVSIPQQDEAGVWSGEVEICVPVQKVP